MSTIHTFAIAEYSLSNQALQSFLSPENLTNQEPLAKRVESIPAKTKDLSKDGNHQRFQKFLFDELAQFEIVSRAQNQALLVLDTFKISRPTKESEMYEKFVTQEKTLSEQLKKIQGLVGLMKTNLNNAAYEWENMQGLIGYFSWLPTFSHDYLERALANYRSQKTMETTKVPNPIPNPIQEPAPEPIKASPTIESDKVTPTSANPSDTPASLAVSSKAAEITAAPTDANPSPTPETPEDWPPLVPNKRLMPMKPVIWPTI